MQIRNVWAVGRNYAEHAKELGNATPAPSSAPMIFLKAGSSVVANGENFVLPSFSKDVHHELEIALRFNTQGEFDAITLAIDLTARDIQSELKSKQHPWTLAKSFKDSCLMGPVAPLPSDLRTISFVLKVNGEVRQSGSSADMIYDAETLRAYVVDRFPVREGDWLLTGTPAGVGPVRAGDILSAEIPDLVRAEWRAV